MPSWNDGETSSDGPLSAGFPEGGYSPDSIEDPTFGGIDLDSTQLCVGHKQLPERFVAFEGTNTGRRFLACAVKNEVENCGFVGWIDPEWPSTLQHAVSSLWAKLDESNSARIDDQILNVELIKKLSEEKSKLDKKYTGLIAEVNKLLDDTCEKVRQENYAKIMNEEDGQQDTLREYGRMQVKKQLVEVVKERDNLKQELLMLKEVHKNDSELLKILQKKWEGEREELKEEKKKLEYMLFDLLKANDLNKGKLKRIMDICDE